MQRVEGTVQIPARRGKEDAGPAGDVGCPGVVAVGSDEG